MRWSRREQRIFSCLADTLLAPQAPLPAVDETDTVQAFGEWLSRFSLPAQLGLRASLVTIELAPRLKGRPWHSLSPAERLGAIEQIERLGPQAASMVAALRAAAGSSYYGDPRVASLLGYKAPGER